MSNIDTLALREAAEQAMHDDWGFDADLFHELVNHRLCWRCWMNGKQPTSA